MVKLKSLVKNGEKQILLHKLYNFIDDNMDTVYNKFKGSNHLSQLRSTIKKTNVSDQYMR